MYHAPASALQLDGLKLDPKAALPSDNMLVSRRDDMWLHN